MASLNSSGFLALNIPQAYLGLMCLTPPVDKPVAVVLPALSDEAETIARAEYSWSKTQGRDWQFGIEGAFNYLDIASRLFLFNPANNNFEEDLSLSGASSRVEEKRS